MKNTLYIFILSVFFSIQCFASSITKTTVSMPATQYSWKTEDNQKVAQCLRIVFSHTHSSCIVITDVRRALAPQFPSDSVTNCSEIIVKFDECIGT